MTTLLITFIGLFVITLWLLVIQFIRNSRLEKLVENVIQNFESILSIISSTKKTLENEQLKAAFSNDDEVGDFFREIEQIQNLLNEYLIDGQESN